MQFIPTNDAFHHICKLLRIHRDKDLLIDIFSRSGWDVTKSKLKAWQTKTGNNPGYREMPRDALDDFISALYDLKLVEDESPDI